METSVHLFTYEESLSMPENKLEEILDGESRIMPPPTSFHRAFLRKLARDLERLLPAFDVCREPIGLGIRRVPFRYRVPDISVFPEKLFTEDIFENQPDPYIWTPPILIAECLSPSNRKGKVADLIQDYKSIGVPEVWFFHPEKRIFDGYGHSELAARIDLDELWTAFHGKQALDQ